MWPARRRFAFIGFLAWLLYTTLSFNARNTSPKKQFLYKDIFQVSYESYEPQRETSSCVLLLPGFGVGSFHFNRNMGDLAEDFRVFSLDLVGQGGSWPREPIAAHHQWRYSTESWRDQIIYFIDSIIGSKVHLVGNSLGGYLATAVRCRARFLTCLFNYAAFT